MIIDKAAARRFLLTKHGLYRERLFIGEEGIMKLIKQLGCIQFDPIDVCGKNHELVLQSRIDGFKIEQINKLLYQDRKLIDCWDKNMAILSVEDWQFLERRRKHSMNSDRYSKELREAGKILKQHIRENGPICSSEIKMGKKVDWFWAPTSMARASLEALFFNGELGVHHKKNIKRYYDLIENILPMDILNMEDPHISEEEFHDWNILRRIGSVGMLSGKGSDGLLGIVGLNSKKRVDSFSRLEKQGSIVPVEIEGSASTYYIKREDLELLEMISTLELNTDAEISPDERINPDERMEFIAPLDNLIWDRKIIRDLFGFDYKWEIYTPEKDRKYGYYVLPILYGDRFIGRIEIRKNRKEKSIFVKGLWWEPEVVVTENLEKKLEGTLIRFSEFCFLI